jgi:hypothetical protein
MGNKVGAMMGVPIGVDVVGVTGGIRIQTEKTLQVVFLGSCFLTRAGTWKRFKATMLFIRKSASRIVRTAKRSFLIQRTRGEGRREMIFLVRDGAEMIDTRTR